MHDASSKGPTIISIWKELIIKNTNDIDIDVVSNEKYRSKWFLKRMLWKGLSALLENSKTDITSTSDNTKDEVVGSISSFNKSYYS